MKNLFFLLIILIWNVTSKVKKHEMQDYIQFQFTGAEQYSLRQLFIVKRSVDFQTIEDRLNELGLHSTHELTQKEKELFWERMFNPIITNDITFSKIIDFIDDNQKFYSEKGQSHFSIIINGKRHPIILKLQKEFFNKLALYLTNENCDTAVIKQINSY